MGNKSNSLSRVKRHQREKVLRFSIRKYSFGAASVAVAALMFLGARVASADSVIANNSQPTTDVVNQKEKDKSLTEIQQPTDIKVEVAQNPSEKKMTTNNENVVKVVDKAKLKKVVEELKTTLSSKSDLDKSVISPIKDRVQKGQALLDSDTATQKDVDELLSLLESDLTVLSNATKASSKVQETATENKTEIKDNKITSELSEADKTISDKKESLKLSADQLQAAVLELPEHESTKEVFEKANELLGLAQGVIQNTTVSLNDVEDMTKRVKRMFNSVKNATTRLTSGARDSRNGQSMGQGTHFRTDGQISSGALANIRYFASVDPNMAGNNGRRTRNDEPELTLNKTDIKAYYMQDSEGKWIVYDVFFNNDGRKMTVNSYQQHYYFQAPFNIMDPSNTVKELTFTRYRNTGGRRLSDGFQGFEQYGNTATITNPWSQQYRIFNADRDTFYDPNSGVTRDNQRWDVFKNNQNDPTLNQLTKDKNNRYPGLSYYLGLDVRRESSDYAVHMHAKIKLKNDITEAEANAYGRVYAASVTKGPTTNQSYIMGTLGTSLTPRDTTPPTITANNATVTKSEPITPISVTAEDNRGGVGMRDNNPIEVSGLPSGLTYSNGRITGTPTGAPGNSTVTIKAYDKNGNMGTKTITITVRSQADVYNPTGAGLTVNQNHTITDAELKAKVSNAGPGTLSIVSRPSTANAGNAGNAVVQVRYPDGSSENVDVPVTVTDVTGPTITANGATVTNREPITPIPVTAEDNRGGVGMRQNNPIEVTGLPAGLTYSNGQITGTPTGTPGNSTVTIKAYDRNNTPTTKTITITVQSQADAHNPTGAGLTVDQYHTITDDEVKAKVSNFAPGTLSVVSKPSTTNAGNVGNAVVQVRYPDGSSENVDVPVTVTEAPDNQPPTLTISPASQTVVEGTTVTFAVTARDNKVVNLDAGDFLKKYGTRFFSGKATSTNVKVTDTEKITKITITTTAEDVGKTTTITFNATDNAGNRANPVTFTLTVTAPDTIPPTITADGATVTNREPIPEIPVTAVDNTGGVGMRDNNPIEVTGLPAGLTYSNGRITGTPTGAPGNSTVTIKAYDKNGNMGTKTITITVRSQADAHTPTGAGLTVNQNHTITDAELKAKVSNYAPGTLTVVSRPSTANAGNAGNAVVQVRYPDGSSENVDVPVTVTDVTGPTITANGATVTNREPITPIPVTAEDNRGGVGMRQNNPIEVTGLPAGLTYSNGRITGTPTGAPGNSTVTIKAYDRNNTPTTKTITITVRSQAEVHTPTGAGLTVNQNHTITDAELKAKVSNYAPGTLTVVSRPSTANAGNAGNAVVQVRYPDGSSENVDVPVTVTDVTGPTITANGATVTNREPIPEIPVTAEDNRGGVGMRDNNPIVVTDLPAGLTFANGKITGTPTGTAGTKRVTITAYDKNNTPTTKVIEIVVQEQKVKYNPTGETLTVPYNHNITDDEVKAKVQNYAPGTLTVQSKPSTNTSGNVGNAVVIVTYPDGSTETVDVPVVVGRPNKDDYAPKYDDGRGKPGTSVEIPVGEASGKTIPAGTTYTSLTPGITVDNNGKVTVTIPADKNPGDIINGNVRVRYPDGSEEEVPVTVRVINRDKDDYAPRYNDGSGKPGTSVEIPVGEASGKTIPAGTTYTSGTPGITVDNNGKVTVTIPADKNPGDIINGNVRVRYPDGSEEEVPVTVRVINRDKDDYAPRYNDGSGKPGTSVEIPVGEASGKTIPAGTTYTSGTPGITVDNNGKVTVTIPADKNPGDIINGNVRVRYPDGSEEEVPVTVRVI
ncbi:Rib/alpha-like domain-containing protein, partial [uncultured Streptococcus sp.]|uniref:Rib/alpha-like domain-containing protein n=1 Tax=uncultured Streptococcus sp. TaxID=83427 RepID=UPI0028D198E8